MAASFARCSSDRVDSEEQKRLRDIYHKEPYFSPASADQKVVSSHPLDLALEPQEHSLFYIAPQSPNPLFSAWKMLFLGAIG